MNSTVQYSAVQYTKVQFSCTVECRVCLCSCCFLSGNLLARLLQHSTGLDFSVQCACTTLSMTSLYMDFTVHGLHCSRVNFTPLDCTTLHYTGLNYTALLFTDLCCTSMYCIVSPLLLSCLASPVKCNMCLKIRG